MEEQALIFQGGAQGGYYEWTRHPLATKSLIKPGVHWSLLEILLRGWEAVQLGL